jgi:hypothetical protein
MGEPSCVPSNDANTSTTVAATGDLLDFAII